ncbi:MAG TPA: phage baseplate protein [Thermoanaerobaculia bacterium]|nr:phage baseplate protein [Thermoanaerobaculia bacterium]
MIDRTLTQAELLSVWERGEGQRPSRRALALAPDAATLPIGRRDASLLDLRVAMFGSDFTGVTSCPACGEEIELTFGADEVRREAPLHDPSLRLPTTEDLIAIEHMTDLASARAMLLERCGASEEAVALMAEADPQADVQIDADCPACEHRWREPFDIAAFLWTEISVLARRLLLEVHELASAYGWSEREILDLSPARRNAYLEMVR